MVSHRFTIVWGDDAEYPGCSEAEATFETRAEAEAAIDDLEASGEWADADLRVVETFG